ncbi:MAG: hypothetical protein IKO43_03895 [Kiritimatiellae bacterium]|nr:hypothetical protein [Kiritimatiellia bacterium]
MTYIIPLLPRYGKWALAAPPLFSHATTAFHLAFFDRIYRIHRIDYGVELRRRRAGQILRSL